VASNESSSQSDAEGKGPAIIRPSELHLSEAEEEICREAFERGGLIAFPTDTVYGVGVDAGNSEAVRRLFEAKRRPANKPLPVLVSSSGLLHCFPHPPGLPRAARELVSEFWPGPLTIVVVRSHRICPEAVAGKPTVGLRMPRLAVATQVLDAVGGFMAVTSANLSGEASAVSGAEVLRTMGPSLDVVIDMRIPASGVPSTVIDLTTSPPCVLREGAITVQQLASVIGEVVSPWKDPFLE